MNPRECEQKANEVREKYNPKNLVPFPYENISNELTDLDILMSEFDTESIGSVSGVIIYNQESDNFTILINSKKPKTRQNFTIAHELGHYFLHKEYLKESGIIVEDDKDKKVLYREDDAPRTKMEIEADNFAAALIMPENLVRDAWRRIGDIEDCAKIFEVSAIAMSIRLERLGLID